MLCGIIRRSSIQRMQSRKSEQQYNLIWNWLIATLSVTPRYWTIACNIVCSIIKIHNPFMTLLEHWAPESLLPAASWSWWRGMEDLAFASKQKHTNLLCQSISPMIYLSRSIIIYACVRKYVYMHAFAFISCIFEMYVLYACIYIYMYSQNICVYGKVFVCFDVYFSGIEGLGYGLPSATPNAGSHSSIGASQVQANEDGTYIHTDRHTYVYLYVERMYLVQYFFSPLYPMYVCMYVCMRWIAAHTIPNVCMYVCMYVCNFSLKN